MLVAMKVSAHTKMRELMPLLDEERIKQIAEEVPAVPLDKPLLRMTCGEFIGALDEKFALAYFEREEYVFTAFGKYKQYLAEMQGITAYIKRYEVEQDADEKAAAQGVEFPTMQERILLDCVRAYRLRSTEEAEQLPVTDWLLIVKSEGAAAQYQRRLSKIQQNKQRNGRK